MTDRGQITEMLSLSLEKYINPQNDPRIYWAKEVTFLVWSACSYREVSTGVMTLESEDRSPSWVRG